VSLWAAINNSHTASRISVRAAIDFAFQEAQVTGILIAQSGHIKIFIVPLGEMAKSTQGKKS